MRKLIVICLLCVATFMLVYKFSEKEVLAEIPLDSLIIFSQEGCPHCQHALNYIQNTLRPKYPNLKIEVLDIRHDRKNLSQFFALAKSFHLPEDQLGTPLIVYGKHFTMGWSDAQSGELESWLKK